MRTIVVGFDGSVAARGALDRAAELAHALGCKVVVASVAEPRSVDPLLEPLVAVGHYGPYAPAAPTARPDAGPSPHPYAVWEHLLSEARARLEAQGITAETALAVGRPVKEIVEVAEEHDADLIVVGTHDPGLFERLLRGSVSEGVVRKAYCDVLVVHPEHKRIR